MEFKVLTNIFTNRPILIRLDQVVALEEVVVEGLPNSTKVQVGPVTYQVKEPIQSFFARPKPADVPDSGLSEVSGSPV